MAMWPKFLGTALLSAGLLTAGASLDVRAAAPATSDILGGDRTGEGTEAVDVGAVRPIARPSREGGRPLPSGNPLWAVPLSALAVTQERPIFSASRRPPQRAVVAPLDQVSAPLPQKGAEPERPPLGLIGAVVGDSDAIAVFLDQTSQKVVRLRQGEAHAGWVLTSVLGREVTLRKADRTETLGLQRPDGLPGAGTPVPGLTVPVSGGVDLSYAPFTPRSTPKNGESDGL
jgi:general secretion pathway protein N